VVLNGSHVLIDLQVLGMSVVIMYKGSCKSIPRYSTSYYYFNWCACYDNFLSISEM